MDMYLLLSFASGVAITTLAFILLLVRIEPDEESRKIRFARAILAASYFLLAVPDWLNIYGLNDSEDIAAATIVSVSIQSLLFTFTLITMIRPSLVTMRRILINVALVAVGSLCFLVVDSLAGSPIVTCVAVAAVIVQLILYSALFLRCYKKFVRQVKDYYDEEYERPLRWARNSFIAALTVGVSALLSLTVPQPVYNAFMCCYIAFYVWFASRFINYIIRSDYYLPAVKSSPDEAAGLKSDQETMVSDSEFNVSEELMSRLKASLDEYVALKDYLNPERDRNYIIERSGVDPRFFPLVLPECDGAGLPCLESQPEDRRGEEDNHGNSGRLNERSCDETRLRNVPEFLPSFQESGRPDSYGVHGNLWDESA